VVLDLTEVSLVDGEVVQFLLRCEGQGYRLVGCPATSASGMVRDAGLSEEDEMDQMSQAKQVRVSRTLFSCTEGL
jgi:hypothetical protein